MQLRDLLNDTPLPAGDVIPLPLQQLLRSDLNIKESWETAENLLVRAQEEMPDSLELLVAHYKLCAYSNRLEEAEKLIKLTLKRAAAQGNFDDNWPKFVEEGQEWDDITGPRRIYLYSLKASGFVWLRMGKWPEAQEVLNALALFDPKDEVGSSVVRSMAERLLEEED